MKASSWRFWALIAAAWILVIVLATLLILEANRRNSDYQMTTTAIEVSGGGFVQTAIAATVTAKSLTNTPTR